VRNNPQPATGLYVLACENGVTSIQLRQSVLQHTAAAAQEIDAAADFIPCVVDRVCDAIKTKSDRVVVRAELFGRLSLPATVDRHFFVHNAKNRNLIRIESDLDLVIMKKAWLFNGPHLILAINAFYERELDFRQYVRDNPELVEEVLQEYSIGCLQSWSERHPLTHDSAVKLNEELRLTAHDTHQRFRQNPDIVERIAHRFARPTEKQPMGLQEFFSNMAYKVVEPTLAYQRRTGTRLTELM